MNNSCNSLVARYLEKSKNRLVRPLILIGIFFIQMVAADELTTVPPPAPPKATETVPGGSDIISDLNFVGFSLDQVIDYYADLTHRIAIRGMQVQQYGQYKFSLKSNGPITKEEAIIAIHNLLTANQLAIVNQGEKFFKIVPLATAKQEGIEIKMTPERIIPADQMISRIFQLKYIDPAEVQRSISTLLRNPAAIVPLPRSNSVLITDTAANILEASKIIDLLDRPLEAKVRTKFYLLHNAKAQDVVTKIEKLISEGKKTKTSVPGAPNVPTPPEGVPPEAMPSMAPQVSGGEITLSEESLIVGNATMVPDERTNQIILLTRDANFPFFDQIIKQLDADTAAPLIIKSFALKYADAQEMAGLLGQVLGRGGSSTGSQTRNDRVSRQSSSSNGNSSTTGQRNSANNSYSNQRLPTSPASPTSGNSGPTGSSGKAGEGPSVYADSRANALIVMGTSSEVRWVQDFIKEVDVLLPQILLEGLIAEVTLGRDDTFGLEVLARASDGQLTQGTLFNPDSIRAINSSTIGDIATLPAGLPGGLSYFASLSRTHIDVLVRALTSKTNVRILSQPLIQTSHNEEADINISDRRPFPSSTTTFNSSTEGNTQTSIEYQDIGLKLKVKPLVNPDGLVVLDIHQEISNVNGTQRIDNNDIPVVATREANSVVAVQDGSMVILGGLTSNSDSTTRSGIPLLSEIPVLGYLFSTTGKTKNRTELLVLLKPTVLRSPLNASDEQYARRKAMELFEQKKINRDLDKEALPSSLKAQEIDVDFESLPPNPEGLLHANPNFRSK